jgi:hypothetical protein
MTAPPASRHLASLRLIGCAGVLALLSACAHHPQVAPVSAEQEARQYQERARGDYLPPGPPEDPWGPYISEASTRFDVPGQWIRSLMRVESGGRLYRNGELITSNVGAMGLMQVMPGTYDELRLRYDLGEDPFDPHNNILAGVAYMREMYDIYGAPGFLAAYNAGPRRLDDYLANNRPLPDETRRYVALIAPNLYGATPATVSPAEHYEMNALPDDIPPGLRYGRPVEVAEARPARVAAHRGRGDRQLAHMPEPPRAQLAYARGASSRVQTAMAAPARGGFHLISPAMAAEPPVPRGKVAVHAAAPAAHASAHPAACAKTARGRCA